MNKLDYFNKNKCRSCKYRGIINGSYRRVMHIDSSEQIHCSYALMTGKTALKRGKKGKKSTIYDSRGDDFENCKLYEER